jgi:hypothetical protein
VRPCRLSAEFLLRASTATVKVRSDSAATLPRNSGWPVMPADRSFTPRRSSRMGIVAGLVAGPSTSAPTSLADAPAALPAPQLAATNAVAHGLDDSVGTRLSCTNPAIETSNPHPEAVGDEHNHSHLAVSSPRPPVPQPPGVYRAGPPRAAAARGAHRRPQPSPSHGHGLDSRPSTSHVLPRTIHTHQERQLPTR